jgi:hypothetical protein
MPLSYKDTSAPLQEPLTLDEAKLQCRIDPGFNDDDDYVTSLMIGARQHVEKLMRRAIFPRGMQLFMDHFPFPIYDGTININDRHCLYGYFWHALAIRLPRPRCLSVQSITYIDLNGVTQTLPTTQYFVDINSEPARIVPQPGQYWPYTQSWLPNSVCVSFTAGSHVLTMAEAVQVPAAAPYALPLTQLAKFVGMISLVDGSGNPVTVTGGVTPAVGAQYAGQTLTASYYVANCPETIKQAMKLLISHWYNNREAAQVQPPKEIDLGVAALLGPETFDTFGL